MVGLHMFTEFVSLLLEGRPNAVVTAMMHMCGIDYAKSFEFPPTQLTLNQMQACLCTKLGVKDNCCTMHHNYPPLSTRQQIFCSSNCHGAHSECT
jgi:hypothetical protein